MPQPLRWLRHNQVSCVWLLVILGAILATIVNRPWFTIGELILICCLVAISVLRLTRRRRTPCSQPCPQPCSQPCPQPNPQPSPVSQS